MEQKFHQELFKYYDLLHKSKDPPTSLYQSQAEYWIQSIPSLLLLPRQAPTSLCQQSSNIYIKVPTPSLFKQKLFTEDNFRLYPLFGKPGFTPCSQVNHANSRLICPCKRGREGLESHTGLHTVTSAASVFLPSKR